MRGGITKYKPEYCQQIIDFFDVSPYEIEEKVTYHQNGDKTVERIKVSIEFPMLIQFCKKIGVLYHAVEDWAKKHPEFGAAFQTAKKYQEYIIASNGMKGRYDKTFAIFALKNVAGWRDTQHNVNEGVTKLEITPEQAKQALSHAKKRKKNKAEPAEK